MKEFISSENFSILKSKEPELFIIAGYASTPAVDREGDVITLEALSGAFPSFLKNALFRNVNLKHSNVQIGVVLDDYRDADGKMWKSGMDTHGLFIVSSIRDDIRKAQVARKQIQDGVLRAYSIGGDPIKTAQVEKDGFSLREIRKMEIHEFTICEVPMNQESEFELLKMQQRWKRPVILKDGKYQLKKS